MKVVRSWRVQNTTIFTCGLLAVVAGIGFAKLGWSMSVWAVIVSALFVIGGLKQRRLGAVLSVLLLGFSLGGWRGSQMQQRLEPYRQVYDHKVILRVTALTDAVYSAHSQLAFDAGSVHIYSPVNQSVPGSLSIKGLGENSVYRGDRLQIEGKLQPTLGGKQGRMNFAKITLLGHQDTWINNIRRRFTAGLVSAVPEPQASFGIGLLIGQRNTLPDTITKQLSAVGLSHVVAVSGYNLTIIVDSVRRLLNKGSKYQSTILSLLLIGGFLLVTGLSASMVRAAMVSTLGLLAWYYGRKFQPLLLWSLVAAGTAAWNPLYMWGDIGWYLSFGAFFGVLILCPLVLKRLYGPERQPTTLVLLLVECFCAQIVTAPIILFVFQQASLVALPANALVVPLIPLAMLLTFVAGLGGMLAVSVSGWFAWPARILLTAQLDAVGLFARIPHAQVSRSQIGRAHV